jgi:hypothetical protein
MLRIVLSSHSANSNEILLDRGLDELQSQCGHNGK